MRYRRFGGTEMNVSEIGVGAARLGAVLRSGTGRDVARMLGDALDSGVTFFDTADIYGQGRSEELIGDLLRKHRDGVVVATKGGYRFSSAASFAARFKAVARPFIRSLGALRRAAAKARASQLSQDFSRGHMRAAIEGSLRRLRTDRIDIYQLHSPPADVLRTGDVFATLDDLQAEGKLRYYGVSCLTVDDALIAVHLPGVRCVQVAINLLERDAITRLLPVARQRGVAVIARQPFAAGLLVGAGAEINAAAPGTNGARSEEQSRVSAELRELATGSRTMAQAALQFVLRQDGVSVALPGITSIAHLRENLGALTAPPLTDRELSCLNSSGGRPYAAGCA